MPEELKDTNRPAALRIDISDADIYDAMKDMEGYLDITPSDLKEVMRFAYRRAVSRVASMVKARDIMTAPVVSVAGDLLLADVTRIMADQEVSGVPVLDSSGTVAGVISVKDFLTRMGIRDKVHLMGIIAECMGSGHCLTPSIGAKRADEIMSSPAVCVGRETTLAEIAAILTTKKIGRVPVVDARGRLEGIVSKTDMIRANFLVGR